VKEEVKNEKLSKDKMLLVENNINYAKVLAKQFYKERANLGFDLEDYEGAAMLGLCDAARRYDIEKCNHFRTFSYFRIRGAMFDLLRHGGGIPKKHFKQLINNKQDESNKNDKEVNKNHFPYSFPKSNKELASMIATIDDINLRIYLDSDDGSPDISYSRSPNPEKTTIRRNTKQYLLKLIKNLPADQQEFISLRYFSHYSYKQLSKRFTGYSKSWLSRMNGQALENLKTMMIHHTAECEKRALESYTCID
jgi:RNA polymerase sigma factor FliA